MKKLRAFVHTATSHVAHTARKNMTVTTRTLAKTKSRHFVAPSQQASNEAILFLPPKIMPSANIFWKPRSRTAIRHHIFSPCQTHNTHTKGELLVNTKDQLPLELSMAKRGTSSTTSTIDTVFVFSRNYPAAGPPHHPPPPLSTRHPKTHSTPATVTMSPAPAAGAPSGSLVTPRVTNSSATLCGPLCSPPPSLPNVLSDIPTSTTPETILPVASRPRYLSLYTKARARERDRARERAESRELPNVGMNSRRASQGERMR